MIQSFFIVLVELSQSYYQLTFNPTEPFTGDFTCESPPLDHVWPISL